MNEEIKKDIVEIKKILFLLYKEIACNFDKMAEISIFSEQLSREIERFSILIEENGQITAPTLSDGIQIISKENLSLQSRPNYKNSLYNQHSIDYSYIESNKYQSLLKQLEGENKIMVSLREKNTPTSFIQFCTSAINSMESIITELFDAEYLCLHNDKSDKKFLMAYDKLCQAYKAKKFTLPPDIYVNNCTNIQSNDYIKICDNKYISKKQFEQLKHKTQESIEIFFYIIDINYQQKQCLSERYYFIKRIKAFRNIDSHGSNKQVEQRIESLFTANNKRIKEMYYPSPKHNEIKDTVNWFVREVYKRICQISP